MNNNNSFSFNRVALLLKRYFAENWTNDLRIFLIVCGVFTIILWYDILYIYFFICTLFTSRFFNNFHDQSGSMHYLLLPATSLEKTVTTFILNTIYFLVFTMAAYFIGNSLAYLLVISGLSSGILSNIYLIDLQSCFSLLSINASELLQLATYFVALQAVFTFGTVYFKGKYPFIKTSLVVFVCVIILAIVMRLIIKTVTGESLISAEISVAYSTFFDATNLALKILSYFIAPVFWVLAYFQLTKKEV